ncbi:hypothetical protein CPLU01_06112 [Colletotrichum plurivorum]|uniref:Uncharacterized protein n=1 Tax=Colletotrichum plurivorum TaxID=2175906 RepID=A0A8H6KJP2_9PEZI|nr:hypothetical protein CPLU01_06112 [Colletotrichum plurivorum]
MDGLSRWWQVVLLLAALLLVPGAHSRDCQGTIGILTQEDAEAVRKCRVVDGDILIAVEESQDIDLSGVEVVTGGIAAVSIPYNIRITISSSTLTTVGGALSLFEVHALRRLSLPKLEIVGRWFSLYYCNNLEYLDITSLHTAQSFQIIAPKLSVLEHTEIREIKGTGPDEGIFIGASSLESVNSVFDNNIKVNRAILEKSPKLKRVVVGFNETDVLAIDNTAFKEGPSFDVIFGGKNTRSQKMREINLSGGVASVRRDSRLQSLVAETFTARANNGTHLHLPFDQLRKAVVRDDKVLKWISNTARAEQWTDFSLVLANIPNLNLSSEYTVNNRGVTVQTWHWPKKDMVEVMVKDGTNVKEGFFTSFLEHENATAHTAEQTKVKNFVLEPQNKQELDCRPFKPLFDEGVLKGKCTGTAGSTSSAHL